MSVAITVQFSPQAVQFTQKFRDQPREFPRAIKRGMDKSLAIVSGRIQEKRLTGRGPFPVEQHRLGERTGQLKLRTRSTPAVITEGETATVEGAIGSSALYAAYNEFGTRKTPERAPFRTGIKENLQYIADEISKAVTDALKS